MSATRYGVMMLRHARTAAGQVGGLVIGTDGFLVSQSEQLAALTVRFALPTIFQYRAFVTAGGLMSYGGSVTDLPSVRRLYWPHSQRREASRPARAAGHEGRVDHQSQDCQDAWYHLPDHSARARRRGD
jgi:hypothetical protein